MKKILNTQNVINTDKKTTNTCILPHKISNSAEVTSSTTITQ